MKLFTLIVFGLVFSMFGCWKPYDVPEYSEINTNETGFLIPLEGNTTSQANFKSVDFLKEKQIATKRVQITHRWDQTGRLESTGKWIPSVRLIKVDRLPVTREWTADNNTGTSSKDQGIWAESNDSVGFSTGFTCTAFIAEEDAATFLYYYTSKSLEQVMDTEIRGVFQSIVSEIALKYDMDKLRGEKKEIIDAVRNGVSAPASQPYIEERTTGNAIQDGVIKFFKRRGITITTVGMFGGFKYENPQIQDSIDKVFIAQQEKVVNAAKLAAQADANARKISEADASAEAARKAAKGEADALREIAKAADEAQQNPMFYKLKLLEIQKTQVEKWDGKYPVYYMGLGGDDKSGDTPNLLLNVPSAVPSAVPNAQK